MLILKFQLPSVELRSCVKSRGGRPGLPVPNSPYGLCGREATLNKSDLQHESAEIVSVSVLHSVLLQ